MPTLKQLLKNIGLVLSIFITVALAGEGVVRIFSARKPIYVVEMMKYARKLTKLTEPGRHVHRSLAQAHLMGVDISLNSWGHRGPELTTPKPPHSYRVLALGSSVTLGWGVPYEKVFTSLVQDKLNRSRPLGPSTKFEVINAGVANYNTELQSQLLHSQQKEIDPNLVVLHYFLNDVEPIQSTPNPFQKYSYLSTLIVERLRHLEQVFEPKHDLYSHYQALYAKDGPRWNQTLHRIEAIQQALSRKKRRLVVMIVPDLQTLGPESRFETIYSEIENALNQQEIVALNLFPPFQEQYGEAPRQLWVAPDDPHPNPKGHALMAHTLYDYLIESSFR